MYIIDKKKTVNILTGVLLSSSLFGLSGCSLSNKKVSDVSASVANTTERNYNHTVLFFDGNTAILIPCNRFVGKESGFIEVIFDDYGSVTFSSSDITIFDNNKDLSSYEQALNFALSITNEVYNYDDVINGEYNNIALGVNIEREMGITKKKDL